MLTVLHAGGKFGEGGGYKVSGGLHGVGVSVVNALSDELTSTSSATASPGRSPTSRGVPQGAMQKGEPTDETGTTITFLPGRRGLRDARLRLRDARAAPARDGVPHPRPADHDHGRARRGRSSAEFHYEGGIEDFVAYLNENKDPIQEKVIFFEGEGDEGAVEVAMQWNGTYQESVFSFANNINTHEGGSHLSGFRSRADAHDQPLRAQEAACSRRRTRPSRARTSARA